MENSILAKLPFDAGILVIILFAAVIVLAVLVVQLTESQKRMSTQYKSFMKGKDGKTLEDSVINRFQEMDQVALIVRKHQGDIDSVRTTMKSVYQKLGIVKYDAFQEMGGNLSFALTLLDDNNNGFILNSIHSREGCYTYIKEIVKGESFIALAEEEAQSLEKAVNIKNYLD